MLLTSAVICNPYKSSCRPIVIIVTALITDVMLRNFQNVISESTVRFSVTTCDLPMVS